MLYTPSEIILEPDASRMLGSQSISCMTNPRFLNLLKWLGDIIETEAPVSKRKFRLFCESFCGVTLAKSIFMNTREEETEYGLSDLFDPRALM